MHQHEVTVPKLRDCKVEATSEIDRRAVGPITVHKPQSKKICKAAQKRRGADDGALQTVTLSKRRDRAATAPPLQRKEV